LHLIHPLGFNSTDKAARRAGIDHWHHVDRQEHLAIGDFWHWAADRRIHLFSAGATRPYTAIAWQRQDVLLFGRESVGLPKDLVEKLGAWCIPTPGPVRSLNLSNAVAVVAYRALESLEPQLFGS
jgi:tRNA (cytidine/uridine-2'-O-)-methyltransferase